MKDVKKQLFMNVATGSVDTLGNWLCAYSQEELEDKGVADSLAAFELDLEVRKMVPVVAVGNNEYLEV